MGAIARPFVRREDRERTFLPGTRAFPPHPVVICDQFRLPPEVYAAARIPPSLTLVTVVYRCSRQNAAFSGAPAQTSLHQLFIPEKSKNPPLLLLIPPMPRELCPPRLVRNLSVNIVLSSPFFSRQSAMRHSAPPCSVHPKRAPSAQWTKPSDFCHSHRSDHPRCLNSRRNQSGQNPTISPHKSIFRK